MQQSRYSVSRARRHKHCPEGFKRGTHDPLYIRTASEGESSTATFPLPWGTTTDSRGSFYKFIRSWVSLDHRVLSRQILEYKPILIHALNIGINNICELHRETKKWNLRIISRRRRVMLKFELYKITSNINNHIYGTFSFFYYLIC